MKKKKKFILIILYLDDRMKLTTNITNKNTEISTPNATKIYNKT
jgi:hypothetical protein